MTSSVRSSVLTLGFSSLLQPLLQLDRELFITLAADRLHVVLDEFVPVEHAAEVLVVNCLSADGRCQSL